MVIFWLSFFQAVTDQTKMLILRLGCRQKWNMKIYIILIFLVELMLSNLVAIMLNCSIL